MPIQLNGATSGSTTLVATDAVTATLTLPSSTGTLLSTANPQSGGVIQVVSVTKTDLFSTSSASFVDITGLTATITPKFSTSKILVLANICGGSAGSNIYLNMLRNGTNIAQSTAGTQNQTAFWGPPTAYIMYQTPINYLDSPATTSALTYKMQINASGSTIVYVNARATDNYYGGISTITLLEIAG